MCAEGRRPICQDTGIVNVLLQIGMIGKAERGPTGIEAIKKHESACLMAVGGAIAVTAA